jgi:hypothetical protein
MPRVNSETPIVKRIQLAASREGCRLWRNNVGCLQDRQGRWVTYGLCTGSSDLIGFVPVVVTQEMVGKSLALFMAVEAKTLVGKVSEIQRNFIDMVVKSGGIAFVARSEDEFIQNLRGKHGKHD